MLQTGFNLPLFKVYLPLKGGLLEPQDSPIFCLNCGYDLRGTTGNRCSECGKEFDRENYRHSALPWECEHSGPFKILRTAFKVFYGKHNFFEIYRDHTPARALKFRRLVLAFVIIILLLGHLALMIHLKTKGTSPGQILLENAGIRVLQTDNILKWNGNPIPLPYDLLVLQGLCLHGLWGWIVPLLILPLLARDWVYGLSDALSMKSDSPTANNRAKLLGSYLASFPMLFLLMMFLGFIVIIGWDYFDIPSVINVHLNNNLFFGMILAILVVIPFLSALFIFIPVFAAIRLCQWRRGLYSAENVSIFRTLVRLLWIYLWRSCFWLILIPCFIGFMRHCWQGLFVW